MDIRGLAVADDLVRHREAPGPHAAQDVITTLGLDAQSAGLIGRITVKQPLDTVLLKISARASTPREAQQLADAWVAALARQVQAVENPTGKAEQALRIVPIESPALPTAPVSPNTQRNLALGFVLGLMLGMGYALLRSQLDRRVRQPELVERDFGVTVAGTIPETSALVRKKGGLVPLVVTGPRKEKDPGTRPSRSSS